jgi:hypothetical protein
MPPGDHLELGGEFENEAAASKTILGLSPALVLGIAGRSARLWKRSAVSRSATSVLSPSVAFDGQGLGRRQLATTGAL